MSVLVVEIHSGNPDLKEGMELAKEIFGGVWAVHEHGGLKRNQTERGVQKQGCSLDICDVLNLHSLCVLVRYAKVLAGGRLEVLDHSKVKDMWFKLYDGSREGLIFKVCRRGKLFIPEIRKQYHSLISKESANKRTLSKLERIAAEESISLAT
ncbi:MAG: hypothetical protein WC631_02500 [Candidatus Paceibacterota bacterium]